MIIAEHSPSRASDLVAAILSSLYSRAQFDWWWDPIDPETREGILDQLTRLAEHTLEYGALPSAKIWLENQRTVIQEQFEIEADAERDTKWRHVPNDEWEDE